MSDYCSLHPDWTANDDRVGALPRPMRTNVRFSISGDVLFEGGVPEVSPYNHASQEVFMIRGDLLDIIIRRCASNILHCVHKLFIAASSLSPEGAYSFYVQLSNGTIRQHRGQLDAGLTGAEVTISSVLLGWTNAQVTGGGCGQHIYNGMTCSGRRTGSGSAQPRLNAAWRSCGKLEDSVMLL